MRDCSWVPADFGISPDSFKCTSDRTDGQDIKYNCIAWAIGDTENFWWPKAMGGYFWPQGLPREQNNRETVDNFARAFAMHRFTACADSNFEEGYEKIVLFTKCGVPKHAARQLPSGAWTSKLGDAEDIEHQELGTVAGQVYGSPTHAFKRPNPEFQSRAVSIA